MSENDGRVFRNHGREISPQPAMFEHFPLHVLYLSHAAAISVATNTSCIALRTGNLGTRWPAMVKRWSAAWILAGNRATRSRAKQMQARRAVLGTKRPIAPKISRTPVSVTRRSGRGKAGGTMRIKSGRLLPQ